MPKMTNANRAHMARDRIQDAIDHTQAHVVIHLSRQLGAQDPHVVALRKVLRQLEHVLPDLTTWGETEADRARIEIEAREAARRAADAKGRAERQAARRKEEAQRKWDEMRNRERMADLAAEVRRGDKPR